ncbi:hypothetical protein CGCF413_v005233 [Colletotrichum fructicola]|nr:hypothetical protein CGCF413_v005233 [Colletotrichum fructicola]
MAIRLKADGTPLETPDLLAASHLLACDLRHLRAFYRCLACHLKQKKTDFATAVELERHMDEHEGFSFLPKLLQSAGEKAAKKDIQDFLSRKAPTYSREETQVAEVEFDLERPPPTPSPQPHPNRPPPVPPPMLPMGDVGA